MYCSIKNMFFLLFLVFFFCNCDIHNYKKKVASFNLIEHYKHQSVMFRCSTSTIHPSIYLFLPLYPPRCWGRLEGAEGGREGEGEL